MKRILSIILGRDHGLPTYNHAREFCNLPAADSFDDFKNEIQDSTIRQKLEELYDTPEDVDIFVGGILEVRKF